MLARRIQDRGDVLRVVDAEDLHARIVPEIPGRESDRGQVQLQMAKRQADDRPPDRALVHRAQLCGDDPVMPDGERSAKASTRDTRGGLRTFLN